MIRREPNKLIVADALASVAGRCLSRVAAGRTLKSEAGELPVAVQDFADAVVLALGDVGSHPTYSTVQHKYNVACRICWLCGKSMPVDDFQNHCRKHRFLF